MATRVSASTVAIIVLAIALAGSLVFNYTEARGYDRDISALLENYESQHDEIEVAKNNSRSLERALADSKDENADLLSFIKELEARPSEVRYITRTETILEPSDPVYLTPDLPEEHLHVLEEGLVVARFSQEDKEYRFETYTLSFENTLVITEDKTAALLQIETSYEPDVWHEIPVDLVVDRIRTQKLFEPQLGIGVTGSWPLEGSASMYMTMFHPHKRWDLVGIRASGNAQDIRVGLDAVGFNLGDPVPLVNDLWLLGGASINTTANPSIDITIGTKL